MRCDRILCPGKLLPTWSGAGPRLSDVSAAVATGTAGTVARAKEWCYQSLCLIGGTLPVPEVRGVGGICADILRAHKQSSSSLHGSANKLGSKAAGYFTIVTEGSIGLL